MQPSSLIVERNQHIFEDHDSLLILNPPSHDTLVYLSPKSVVTHDFRVWNSHHSALGEKLEFGLISSENNKETKPKHDAALLYMPKSKGELKLLLEFLCSRLDEDAAIYLVGEKKQGIASGAKVLADFASSQYKVDSAKHCQLWCASLDASRRTECFDLDNWIEPYSVGIANQNYRFASIPGVFSFDHLDEGSAMLIEAFCEQPGKRLRGRTLDFGCGSGPIGIVAKSLSPEISLEMVDINWLALECTKRSCILNGVEANIYASDGWGAVEGRFDTVLTNPPFHSGVATEYQTTESFIRGAYDHMSRYASLFLVANSFLKYASVIEARFGTCDILKESSRFRVYKTQR